MIVERSVQYIELLLTCQIDELHSISRYTDREVGVLRLLRMLHGIYELLPAEYIDIQVMCTLIEVSVKNVYELALSLILIVAE